MSKLLRNAVQCNYCGHILESTHRHDFRTHYCELAPKQRKRKWVDTPEGPYSQKLIETDELEPPMIMVDGGLEYARRAGDGHYTELSEYSND